MNKRIILGCILAIFISLLGVSLFLMKKKQDFKRALAVIPEFCLPQAVDNRPFCNTQFVNGKSVVLSYIHPECEFCRTEAQQIRQKADSIGDIQWVLVSFAERDSLQKFMEINQLTDIPGLVMLVDSQHELYDRLQVKNIPTSYVYDRRHRLVTIMPGAVRLEKLIQPANR